MTLFALLRHGPGAATHTHHTYSGLLWRIPLVWIVAALKHPVPLLECNELKASGMAAMSLGFIAESVAVLMVLFHALSLAGLLPSKIAKPLAALVWLVLSVGFLTGA